METIAFLIALIALFIAVIGTLINVHFTLKRRYKINATADQPLISPVISKEPTKLSALKDVKKLAVAEFENELKHAEQIDPSSDFTDILSHHEIAIKNAESIDDIMDEFKDFQHSMLSLAIPNSPLTNIANAIIDKWQRIIDNIDFEAIDKEAKKE